MLDPSEQKLVDDVARHGWHLVCVSTDASGPGFVYSVGLTHTFDHPEIIRFGLDPDTMAQIVNTMGDDARGGRSIAATHPRV